MGGNLITTTRLLHTLDVPQILDLEFDCFVKPHDLYEISVLRKSQHIKMYVVEFSEIVVGYIFLHFQSDAIEIIRLAVKGNYRRQGIGTSLIKCAKQRLEPFECKNLEIVVPERHLGSQLFLRENAFKAARIIRSFDDAGESAYLFRYQMEERH